MEQIASQAKNWGGNEMLMGIKCSALIKKAKADYYLSLTTDCFNDHSKFWKTIKSLQNKKVSSFPLKLKSYTVCTQLILKSLPGLAASTFSFEKLQRRRIEVEEVKKERRAERKYYVKGDGAMRVCET
ncbi:hypothetical protein F7725_010485, partial [Dissostichus mawsoni]